MPGASCPVVDVHSPNRGQEVLVAAGMHAAVAQQGRVRRQAQPADMGAGPTQQASCIHTRLTTSSIASQAANQPTSVVRLHARSCSCELSDFPVHSVNTITVHTHSKFQGCMGHRLPAEDDQTHAGTHRADLFLEALLLQSIYLDRSSCIEHHSQALNMRHGDPSQAPLLSVSTTTYDVSS